MSNSKEHINYIKNIKKNKNKIIIIQILILAIFLIIWEILARYNIINSFLSSSPTNVIKTTISLIKDKTLFTHTAITLYETIISFAISTILGLIIASIMWYFKSVAKVLDPYLTILNSLPKVALGPLIIIWVGASINSIIFMALLITLFITIINIYESFKQTNKNYITLLKSLGASKKDIYFKVIIPSNKKNIINTLKINISMSLIGVIMGELLVSKKGLGYLIMYGSQVFNINLVITAVVILGLISFIMYYILIKLEKNK
ncbi:MAG: ABC transporter permease [Bacilli bacterium]|nr:ABC transporter permease [Bacilli bacterium]